MCEPTYTYKKGEGWLPSLGYFYTMSCGTMIRVEFREPKIGERYNWVSKSENWTPEGEWKTYLEGSSIKYQYIYTERAKESLEVNFQERDFITIHVVSES